MNQFAFSIQLRNDGIRATFCERKINQSVRIFGMLRTSQRSANKFVFKDLPVKEGKSISLENATQTNNN